MRERENKGVADFKRLGLDAGRKLLLKLLHYFLMRESFHLIFAQAGQIELKLEITDNLSRSNKKRALNGLF